MHHNGSFSRFDDSFPWSSQAVCGRLSSNVLAILKCFFLKFFSFSRKTIE